MIHTFYSNAYEGLEAALIQNIREDLRCDPSDLSSAFKKAVIVRPSSYIEDRLARSLADRFSITSGVEFLSLFGWLQPKVGATFRSGSTGSAIDWEIWEALNNPEFIKKAEKLKPRPDKFLNYVEKNRERDSLVELSGQIGALFTNYASHRIDWVLDWLCDKTYKVRRDKQKLLEAQADYGWQKALWQYMQKTGPSQDLNKLKSIGARVDAIRFEGEESTTPVHLFMPFSFPPLLLPFVRAYGQKENAPDLWIYILNPSQEYWFDAMPKTVFDWSIDAEKEDAASRYLKSGNASGRAMIDRLYRFMNSDIKERFETESNLDAEIPAPKGRPSAREFQHLADLRGAFDADAPLFDTESKPEVLACYFDQPNDTYLQKFQNSILKLDDSELPEDVVEGDSSLRIFKAPSFTREIESLVDWFHHCFNEDPELKPSDIVVMVPNIDDAAPQIEAVMTGLPAELYLPWRIYGNSVADSNLTVAAILDFGRLIAGDFEAADFTSWLEYPVMQERWGLTLSDVATLADWLRGAGFRRGLSPEFQHFPTDDCATLADALERLTLGYFIRSDERRVCLNLLPADGTEEGGYEDVRKDRGRLLKILSSVCKNLTDASTALYAADKEFTAQEWYDTVLGWMTELFSVRGSKNELAEFRNSLYRAVSGMKDGLPPEKKVPFAVFWKFLETQMQEAQSKAKPSGAITFTSLEACRGAPFKIVVLAGFAEGAGFPGRSFHYDFDLMGADGLKRRADRDSREDNKARFFDAMMSARQKLVLSYTVGTQAGSEENPASVIQNFLNYFTSNAPKERRDKILRSIEVKLPLNAFSRRNFEAASDDARDWLSPRQGMLKAIQSAIASGFREELPFFATKGLSNAEAGADLKDDTVLPAQVLIDFFANPNNYLLKKHRLSEYSDSGEADFEWMKDTTDKLTKKLFYKDIWDQLNDKYTEKEIIEENELDPAVGIKCIRRKVVEAPVHNLLQLNKDRELKIREFHLEPADSSVTLQVPDPENKELADDLKTVRVDSSTLPFVKLTDNIFGVPQFKADKETTVYFFEPAFSETDKLRAVIRWLIWIAAGKNAKLFIGKEDTFKEIQPAPDTAAAKKLIDAMVHLFDATRRFGYGYNKESDSLFYRGINEDDLVSNSKALSAMFNGLYEEGKNPVEKGIVGAITDKCSELAADTLAARYEDREPGNAKVRKEGESK